MILNLISTTLLHRKHYYKLTGYENFGSCRMEYENFGSCRMEYENFGSCRMEYENFGSCEMELNSQVWRIGYL